MLGGLNERGSGITGVEKFSPLRVAWQKFNK